MYRIIKLALIALGIVSAVLWVQLPSADDPGALDSSSMGFMFYIMYIMLALAAVSALFFGLTKMITTPGGLKKALFSFAGLAVLTIAGYAMAGGEQAVVDAVADERGLEVSTGTVKAIGTLLNVFFGMVAIAILLMVVPGFKRVLGR